MPKKNMEQYEGYAAKDVGAAIKKMRLYLGYASKDFSARCYSSANNLNEIERDGLCTPSLMQRIIKGLGFLSVEDLMSKERLFPPYNKKEMGRVTRIIRVNKSLTQHDVAQRMSTETMECEPKAISSFEISGLGLTVNKVALIPQALGCTSWPTMFKKAQDIELEASSANKALPKRLYRRSAIAASVKNSSSQHPEAGAPVKEGSGWVDNYLNGRSKMGKSNLTL